MISSSDTTPQLGKSPLVSNIPGTTCSCWFIHQDPTNCQLVLLGNQPGWALGGSDVVVLLPWEAVGDSGTHSTQQLGPLRSFGECGVGFLFPLGETG